MKSIEMIIEICGGAKVIAAATQRSSKPIKWDSVRKWRDNGIHHDHWPVLMRLGGLTLQELHDANMALEVLKKQRKRKRPQPGTDSAAA